jgi:hypothetical protein
MPSTDAFALANSGLNTFLFSEVGTELNGSPLTVLSVLGRLGKDPWVEARRWASLPKATTIDAIAASISQMPLHPQALRDARQTASRLSLLLPTADAGSVVSKGVEGATALPRVLVVSLICAAVLAFALSGMLSQHDPISPKLPTPTAVAAPK